MENSISRRSFLGAGIAAATATATVGCTTARASEPAGGRILFGACRGLGDAKLMKEIGYDFFENGVAGMLKPMATGDEWKKQRDAILASPIPLRSCNGFIPGNYRLTGPDAKFDDALVYAENACRHADEVGVKTVVFGSGGARNVPYTFGPGAPKKQADIEYGVVQYTDFCRRLAERISGLKVMVVIEPLRPNESNIINYVWQGLQVVEDVASPRIRQLADIFHMMMGRESAESIVQAGARLKHVHIATYGKRSFPGANDTEKFVPYFAALKKIGYAGGVSCECGWGDRKDLAKNLATALETMKRLSN